jgi:AbiV family abortive infection protein
MEAQLYTAAQLLANVAKEEAGKFLVLLDSCRAPDASDATISRQFGRAADHLAKLMYAEMVDYSIASQGELLRAIERHRQSLYLDGPNDHDWILRNELLAERESALYVDLMESEGILGWSAPYDAVSALDVTPSRSIGLVKALMEAGIISSGGLHFLRDAWSGFDAHQDTHYKDWAKRTELGLKAVAAVQSTGRDWLTAARRVVELWPMPMVELDVEEGRVSVQEMVERRARLQDEWLARELGLPMSDE